jgi:hypothetical protein
MKKADLKPMEAMMFGNFVKAVVDIDRKIVALDAEMHADLEQLLLEHGSEQKNLWGINFYSDMTGEDFVEFDSMINVRPSQNNRSRSVDDPEIRKKILEVVHLWIAE